MKTADFDYSLPAELIAQTPIEPRDQARLMVLNRPDQLLKHHRFYEIVDYLQEGDVLVFNESRVIPARFYARKPDTGGRLEILLLRRLRPNVWEALVKPGRRATVGSRIEIADGSMTERQNLKTSAEIVESKEGGVKVLSFSDETALPELGTIALPPYIRTSLSAPERYQTVYAKDSGSIAAPTAGLHFTAELMDKIRSKRVSCLFVSLHVGLDSFRPVREEEPLQHSIHQEYGVLSREVAEQMAQAKVEGRRIICVGTTTVRLVEAAAQMSSPFQLSPFEGWVSLFILPGYQFRVVDALITNFHLPKSTLLMLVSAFAGRDFIMEAYREAIMSEYRFYSFGDAMLII